MTWPALSESTPSRFRCIVPNRTMSELQAFTLRVEG